jgi:hypothetical protein
LAVFGANNTTDKYITVKNSAGDVYLGSSATSAYLWNVANTPLGFYTNNAERMRIDASGNLGLGVTPANFNGVTFSGKFLDALATVQIRGDATSTLAALQFGGTTYRKALIWTPVGTDTPYLAIGVATSGSSSSVNEVARFDASGNLGLGVTPSAWSASFKAFQLSGLGALWGSSTAVFLSNNTYNDGSNKYIGNGLATRYYQSTGQHIWENAVNNTGGAGAAATLVQAMTLDASGGLQVLNAIGVGNTAPTTSGAGITFPATQSASSNANTLDDYEEGEFTPTATFTTPGTVSTASAVGVYTKIGNVVTVMGRIAITKGTASGDVVLGGLPFASINRSTYQVPGSLSVDDFGVAGKVYYILLVNNSTAPILQTQTQSTGVVATSTAADFYAGAGTIRYSFTYHV